MMAVPGELYRSLDAAYEELKLKYAALGKEVDSLRINQQLKPKMPSLQEFVDIAGEAGIGSASSEWCYNYFACRFGR
jgi:hypothetical protein